MDYSIFKSLVDNHTSGILLENHNRIIQTTNETFMKLFEIPMTPDKLVGLDCSLMGESMTELFENPTQFMIEIQNILSNKKKVLGDIVHLKNGHVYERDYIPIVTDSNYNGHFWVYRDITTQYILSQNNQYIVSSLSHEISNPLNCIIGITDSLLVDLGNSSNGDLELIKKAGKNILDIMQTLVKKDKSVKNTLVNVSECIQDICDTHKPLANKKNLGLSCEINLSNRFLNTKKIYLQQIITNILSNAIKYTQSGHIKVHAQDTPTQLQIKITDTGIGISPENLTTIFKPFSQLDDTDGIGLGLHVSLELLHKLGGTISVESKLAHGTIFTIYFNK